MTPLLLADLAGADDPLADLRAEAVRAVRELAADRVVALCPVGPGAPPAYHHRGETAPLAAIVARHLCHLAGVAPPELLPVEGPVEAPDGVGLLVVGDGSARHDPDGPGGLDPRAAGFDDRLCAALAAGDGAALAALDATLDAGLLVSGGPAYRALGRARPHAAGELRWRGAPYGVTYVVALWCAP